MKLYKILCFLTFLCIVSSPSSHILDSNISLSSRQQAQSIHYVAVLGQANPPQTNLPFKFNWNQVIGIAGGTVFTCILSLLTLLSRKEIILFLVRHGEFITKDNILSVAKEKDLVTRDSFAGIAKERDFVIKSDLQNELESLRRQRASGIDLNDSDACKSVLEAVMKAFKDEPTRLLQVQQDMVGTLRLALIKTFPLEQEKQLKELLDQTSALLSTKVTSSADVLVQSQVIPQPEPQTKALLPSSKNNE